LKKKSTTEKINCATVFFFENSRLSILLIGLWKTINYCGKHLNFCLKRISKMKTDGVSLSVRAVSCAIIAAIVFYYTSRHLIVGGLIN
jgi:hypothetical protein